MAGDNIISSTTITPKVLRSTYLPTGTTDTTQVTVAAGTSVKIATACVTNTTATQATVSISTAATGQNFLDASHRVLHNYMLPAGDTLELSMLKGAMLGPGDMIAGSAGTASAIVLVVTGTVHS